MPSGKLYIVIRADLEPGLQASQAVHAAQRWSKDHPSISDQWIETSNTVVLLNAPDADELDRLLAQATSAGVPVSAFVDDDIDRRLTCIALGPGQLAKKFCRKYPRAFQAGKEAKAA